MQLGEPKKTTVISISNNFYISIKINAMNIIVNTRRQTNSAVSCIMNLFKHRPDDDLSGTIRDCGKLQMSN